MCRNVYAVKREAWKGNNFQVNTDELNPGLKRRGWYAVFTPVNAHVFSVIHTRADAHKHKHKKTTAVQFLNLSNSCPVSLTTIYTQLLELKTSSHTHTHTGHLQLHNSSTVLWE